MTFRYSVKPYFKKPKRLVKTPKLTLAQLVQAVPNKTRLKSRIVGIQRVWRGKTPAFLSGYSCYRAETKNTVNGHRYRLTVYSPTPKVTKETRVIIDDPCPVFIFYYEVAVARRGNAFVYRSNGDLPLQNNPRMIPGVSHHMYKFLSYLVKNTNRNGLRQ